MNTTNESPATQRRLFPTSLRDPKFIGAIRILSWLANLIFLAALIWAIYQAVITENPLPVWAWLEVVVLFAVAVGMAVAVLVYRRAAGRAGPFDFRSSSQVTGEIKSEARRVEANEASSLRVESGVGDLILDLSGEWKHSMGAIIKAGIGDTLLRLPQEVGVRVQSTLGLGSIHPHGLSWDGQAYTNALYGQSAVNLDITVDGGMGKINLEQTG